MGGWRDVVIDSRVKGRLRSFGDQRDAIYSKQRVRRGCDDGLRASVHNRDIVGTWCAAGLLFIGRTFVVTVRLRCGRRPTMLESTSDHALGVARDQSHGKQRHQFRSPMHSFVSYHALSV